MPTLEQIEGVVDAWFLTRIKSGAIAGYTPAYNQAFTALGELKSSIGALFPAPGADASAEPVAEPQAEPAPQPVIEPQPAADDAAAPKE